MIKKIKILLIVGFALMTFVFAEWSGNYEISRGISDAGGLLRISEYYIYRVLISDNLKFYNNQLPEGSGLVIYCKEDNGSNNIYYYYPMNKNPRMFEYFKRELDKAMSSFQFQYLPHNLHATSSDNSGSVQANASDDVNYVNQRYKVLFNYETGPGAFRLLHGVELEKIVDSGRDNSTQGYPW